MTKCAFSAERLFNPFLTNALDYPYHLNETIPSFEVSGGCLHFY